MIAGAFNPTFFNSGLVYAWPEIFLSLAACAILMLDLLLNDAQRRCESFSSKSSIRMAQAASDRKISGHA